MNLLYRHHKSDVRIRVETGNWVRGVPETTTLEVRCTANTHALEAEDGLLMLHVPEIGDDPARSEFWPIERVRSVVVRGVES